MFSLNVIDVWQDKLDDCTSFRKSTRKFEQVSFPPSKILFCKSPHPSTLLRKFDQLQWWIVLAMVVSLWKLRNQKSEGMRNSLFRGNGMGRIKICPSEFGLALSILPHGDILTDGNMIHSSGSYSRKNKVDNETSQFYK